MTYMMEDSRTIPSVLTALFCARSIERIGDRCQNICEYIFYFVKGQDFRHVGGDELDKLLAGKDPKSKSHSFARWRCAYRAYRYRCCRPDKRQRHPAFQLTRNLPPARFPQSRQLRQIGKSRHVRVIDRLVMRIGAEIKHFHSRRNS